MVYMTLHITQNKIHSSRINSDLSIIYQKNRSSCTKYCIKEMWKYIVYFYYLRYITKIIKKSKILSDELLGKLHKLKE